MTEQELRALVRDAVARHLQCPPQVQRVDVVRAHVSHAQFVMPAAMESDGPCLIEPAVPCNHCGFCKSYGH